jgi:hypothetical protein
MAQTNNNLQVTDLDFSTIKTNLIKFLQSQDTLKDYNYTGSALSTLLDLLAYNTQYNSYYLNMVANEMFLDSAINRSSVVSHAKLLNYTPKSASAPNAQINLTFYNVTTSSVTIPKFTNFVSEAIDNVNYNFVTKDSITVNTNIGANTATFLYLNLVQGQPASLSFTYTSATNLTSTFELPDPNIDTSTLSVRVQQTASNTSSKVYTLATDYLRLDSTSNVYFLQEAPNGNYQIYFGDGILGSALNDKNVINVSYISTKGTASTGANNFTLLDSIGGLATYRIDPILAATQGSAKESIASIKYTAPKVYAAQNRAVTKEDYITLIQNNSGVFPVDAVNVWGGEENNPPYYGAIFVAIKPKGGYILTESQKQVIITEIIKPISVLTITPKIVDVDYTYLQINNNVRYDPKLTTLTSSQLAQSVSAAVNAFAQNTLNTFNSTFQLPTLISYVQSANPSIITNDASITLQKRFYPTFTSAQTYTFNFDVALRQDLLSKSISLSPSFQQYDYTSGGTLRNEVFLEEVPQSSTYIESIKIVNPGLGYTDIPTVTILGDGANAAATAVVVNGQLQSIVLNNPGSGYTQALIQITGGGGQFASAIAITSGNKGILRTYYYLNGVKTILNSTAGTVNYSIGEVILTNFNPIQINNSPLGVLSLSAVPKNTIISSSRDKIITLDNTDVNAINVNVTAK